mmetsp:Transcript_22126/g.32609  ORF Transcript_22126/g.32609 Transcript_22126/m.32609 type:complete len:96 (+) Transcript_22126:1250-1537(+)
MISNPQNNAKVKIGGTGQMQVAKNATAVVEVVRNMALAASGRAIFAILSRQPSGFSRRALFHLSTTTNTSSAPNAAETNKPIKFNIGKNFKPKIK